MIRFNQFWPVIIYKYLHYTLAMLYKFTLHLLLLQNKL